MDELETPGEAVLRNADAVLRDAVAVLRDAVAVLRDAVAVLRDAVAAVTGGRTAMVSQPDGLPAAPGAYLLAARLDQACRLGIARMGACPLAPGWYLYAGSARGPAATCAGTAGGIGMWTT